MSDAKQRPDATKDQKPQNQVGEDQGPIKGEQRTDHNTQVVDRSRGSGPATRGSSSNRL